MEKIYIRKKDSVITGPYDVEQLRQRRLQSSDKVWFEGLSEWRPAPKIDFLRRYISPAQGQGFLSRILGTR
jgi:hypothetical protein